MVNGGGMYGTTAEISYQVKFLDSLIFFNEDIHNSEMKSKS